MLKIDEIRKDHILASYLFFMISLPLVATILPDLLYPLSPENVKIHLWVLAIALPAGYHKKPLIETLLITISPALSLFIVTMTLNTAGIGIMYKLGNTPIAGGIIYTIFAIIMTIPLYAAGRVIKENSLNNQNQK